MKTNDSLVLVSAKDFFREIVESAIQKRKLKTFPFVGSYLANLLEFYVSSENLFVAESSSGGTPTLAERLLKAANAEKSEKVDQLKRLADSALYVSGFFGDSFKRKIIDVDYYAEIGGIAYNQLAKSTQEDTLGKVYQEFSVRFLDYVDVLTLISQESAIQTDEDLLRLYDRYIATGSRLAEEQLLEKGLLTTPEIKKASKH